MNQVKARMNNAKGIVVEFPPSEEPKDVTPLVASRLDEVHLQLVAKDAIIKAMQETMITIKNKVCDRNQYSFWKKEMDMIDRALAISYGKLP